MNQVKRFEFFDISRPGDFIILNGILSLLYLIPIYLGFVILLSGLEGTLKFILILALAFFLLILRFSISILFGFKWDQSNKELSKNYILGFFILAGALNLLLVFYYVFYFQINEVISSEILSLMFLPIILITILSLLMSGIENVLYSFMLGAVSLALFVDPASIHHTMGEMIIMYSIGSTLILSPFYVFPSVFIGTFSNKINNNFFKSKIVLKIALMALIPLILISIAHIGFYSIVFGRW